MTCIAEGILKQQIFMLKNGAKIKTLENNLL